jgi:hypothetical protein
VVTLIRLLSADAYRPHPFTLDDRQLERRSGGDRWWSARRRFVTLDSEQQGAQRVLDDAEARLATARQRAQEATDRLLRSDALHFLYNRSVIEAINEGVQDLAELRRRGDSTDLTDNELEPFLQEARRELARAHEVLEGVVPPYKNLKTHLWHDFRRSTPSLPEIGWDLAWQIVFYQIVNRREAESSRMGYGLSGPPHLRGRLPSVPVRHPSDTDWEAIRARRRDDLVANRERAEQQVEDLESEVQRLRQARDAVVRPQGLGWGLIILGYFALVGVVVPIWLMSRGPQDLTPLMGNLVFAGFCSGLLALLGYMAVLAVRLSRRAATSKPNAD